MAIASSVGPLPLTEERTGLLVRASVLSLREAEEPWRQLEQTGISTPNHRFDWIEAWQRHLGAREGIEPAVVVGSDESGAPLVVWPFGVRRVAGLRVASWLGGRFANYQMGVYAQGVLPSLDLQQITRALAALRDTARVDALHLINQPMSWDGHRNPLLELPHQPAPAQAYSLAIGGRPFDEVYAELRSGATRKKLRRAERKMMEDHGGCAIRQPETELEVETVLDVFFQQKRARMAESGTPNVFDEPGVEPFVRELGRRSLGMAEPLLDLYWLQTASEVAATWGGVRDGKRLSGLINSFDLGEIAQLHPGEILLRHVVELACDRRVATFDLGTGDAAYKRSWCPNVDELFESHLALSARGLAYSTASSAFSHGKRRLKRSARAMQLLHRLGIA